MANIQLVILKSLKSDFRVNCKVLDIDLIFYKNKKIKTSGCVKCN